jgi:hypothetical protein
VGAFDCNYPVNFDEVFQQFIKEELKGKVDLVSL